MEFRLKAKDGTWKWILSRGKAATRDANGRALRLVGTHIDFTDRKNLEDITNRFGRILDHSINEIYTFSAESLKFIDVSEGARANLGYTLDEMHTLTPLDIKPEFSRSSFKRLITPLMTGELAEKIITTVHKRKDGSRYPVEIHLQLSRSEIPPVFIVIARDVTIRQAAEDALKESEEKYRMLVDHSQDGIFITQDGHLVFHNRGFREILGYAEEELNGVPLEKCIAPEDREMVIARHYSRLSGSTEPTAYECSLLHRDGTTRRVKMDVGLASYQGRPATIGTIHDVTDERQHEEDLKKSEERFRSFVENANDIVYSLNSKGLFTYVSPQWTELLGYETSETIGRSFEGFLHPDYAAAGRETLKKVITTKGKHLGVEYPVRHKNGSWRWQITNASAISNTRDNSVEFFGIARDITEQKRMDDALRESEEKYRMLAESTSDLIYMIDKDGRVEYINKNAAKIFGKTPAEITGSHLSSIFPPERVKWQEPTLQQILRGGVPCHIEGPLTIDGESQWFDHVLTPIPDGNGNNRAVFGVSRNITWRKHAEEALRESEEKFRWIFEEGPLGMTGLAPDGRFILVNRRFCEMLGYTQEELLAKSIADVTHPDDRTRSSGNLGDLYSGKIALIHDEKKYLKKDGTQIVASVTVTPLRDAKNKITSTISIIEDITQRKHAETLLCDSEQRFRELAELLPQSVWECDIVGNLTFANSGSFDMYRYSRSDFEKGLTIWQMMNPADLQMILTTFKEAVSNPPERFPSFIEYSALRSDGSTFPIRMYLAPIMQNGAIVGMRGIGIDMTAQKQTEQDLREKSGMLQAIFDSTFDFIAILTPAGILTDINRTALDFIGVSRETVLNRPFWETPWWQGNDERVRGLRGAINLAADGKVVRFEEYVQGPGSSRIVMDCSLRPVFSSNGSVWMIIVEGHDISGLKQTEEELRTSEDRFRTIFEDCPQGIAIVGRDYRFVLVNQKFCDMVGYTSEELLKKTFMDITHPDCLEEDLIAVEKMCKGALPAYHTEKQYIKKDGSVIWGSLNLSPLKDNAGRIVSAIAIVKEITGPKPPGHETGSAVPLPCRNESEKEGNY